MKRMLSLLLVLLMVPALCACGSSETGNVPYESLSKDDKIAVFAMDSAEDYFDTYLKDPNSLSVNSIRGGVGENDYYIFEIDYTAANSLGGSVRDTFYVCAAYFSDTDMATVKIGYCDHFYDSESQMYIKQMYNDLNSVNSFDVDSIMSYDFWR